MENIEFKHGFTVRQLKDWIEKFNVPDDAIIMMQRVEDRYFSGIHKNENGEIIHRSTGWKTVKKGGYWYYRFLDHNEKIDSNEFLDKEKYPHTVESELRKYTQKELEGVMEEYYECFSPAHYTDEGDDRFLYLDAHY